MQILATTANQTPTNAERKTSLWPLSLNDGYRVALQVVTK